MQFSRWQVKAVLSVLFGLVIIWTGLGRGIEAAEYKPNALYFCFTMGTIAIIAGYLFQLQLPKIAIVIAVAVSIMVFGFYLSQFIGKPESDANIRVGIVILAAVAHFVSTTFPAPRECCK